MDGCAGKRSSIGVPATRWVALVAALALGWTGVAQATTTASVDSAGRLTVRGDAEDNHITVHRVVPETPQGSSCDTPDGTTCFAVVIVREDRVWGSEPSIVSPGAGCIVDDDSPREMRCMPPADDAQGSGPHGEFAAPTTIDGGAGNDNLRGAQGADVVVGGPGDDRLDGGFGPDVFEGEDGSDTVVYTDRPEAETVTAAIDGVPDSGSDRDLGAVGEMDLIDVDVENLEGGIEPDRFSGDVRTNTLTGGGGDDFLDGNAGSDVLLGGDGDDALAGGPGSDSLVGGRGADDISGQTGSDAVIYREFWRVERVDVSLDETANDGEPGESDNVRDDVEVCIGCSPDGTGSDVATVLVPETTIDAGPEGFTSDNRPTFDFSSNVPATFTCRLDDDPSWSQCYPGTAIGPLADGEHTFRVRAIDGSGTEDPTPAERTFTVDTVAPTVTITAGPDGPTLDHSPTFVFEADEPVTYTCAIDGAPPTDCESSFTAPSPLSDGDSGAHSFNLKATDRVGHTTRVARKFLVTAPTRLEAYPADADIGGVAVTVHPSAMLTNARTDAPVANREISFSIQGGDICTATTDSSGIATCQDPVVALHVVLFGQGFDAAFAGDGGRHAPATAHGDMLSIA